MPRLQLCHIWRGAKLSLELIWGYPFTLCLWYTQIFCCIPLYTVRLLEFSLYVKYQPPATTSYSCWSILYLLIYSRPASSSSSQQPRPHCSFSLLFLLELPCSPLSTQDVYSLKSIFCMIKRACPCDFKCINRHIAWLSSLYSFLFCVAASPCLLGVFYF